MQVRYGIGSCQRNPGDIPQRYLAGCNNHRDLPKVTAALATSGWKAEDIEAYLGGNFKRVLSEIWG